MDEQVQASGETKQQPTDAEIEKIIENAEKWAEEQQKLNLTKVRALPAQRVLTLREADILLSIKEEDLTYEDKIRISWAKLRLRNHRYEGTDYSPKELTKVKRRRKLAKASRKANR